MQLGILRASNDQNLVDWLRHWGSDTACKFVHPTDGKFSSLHVSKLLDANI